MISRRYRKLIIDAVVFLVVGTVLVGLWSCAHPPKTVTSGELWSHPNECHGKWVVVTGRATLVRERVSRANNVYYTFNLKTDDSHAVNVFSFGTAPIQSGDRVRVKGKFYKLRRVGNAVYRNELDATDGYVRAE